MNKEKHMRLIPSACLIAGLLVVFPAWGDSAAKPRSAKDIGITRLAGQPGDQEAIVVSVLIANPDGTLAPRAANQQFRTGERFKVRVQTSQDGTLLLTNITPRGEQRELLRIQASAQGELLLPREPGTLFELTGNAGEDQLIVTLLPQGMPSAKGLVSLGAKDIRLAVEHTQSASYLTQERGQPIQTVIRISHSR
jgi:hypothetical protein